MKDRKDTIIQPDFVNLAYGYSEWGVRLQ